MALMLNQALIMQYLQLRFLLLVKADTRQAFLQLHHILVPLQVLQQLLEAALNHSLIAPVAALLQLILPEGLLIKFINSPVMALFQGALATQIVQKFY
jgi:hypothetical protein